MAMKLSRITNPTKRLGVTITYDDNGAPKEEQLFVTHRVLTPELFAKIKQRKPAPAEMKADGEQAEEPKAEKDALVTELLELLIDWEVEDEHNRPVPINEQTLGQIDYRVLKEIDTAIYSYTFPNATT